MLQISMTFFILFKIISTGDPACYKQNKDKNNTISDSEICTKTDTGTFNTCCHVSYKFPNNTDFKQCMTLDNFTPQTLLISRDKVIKGLTEEGNTDINIVCGTDTEKCEATSNPTGFEDCNKTTSYLPGNFSCCIINLSDKSYCYPVNARYNSTVQNYAEMLQEDLGIDYLPDIICSDSPLPVETGDSFVHFSFLMFFLVIFMV